MTLPQIEQYISEREHWKKGDEWWADYLEVPVSKVKEARGTLDSANASDYDNYDSRENHDNENKNRANKTSAPTAMQDQTLEEYLDSVNLDPEKVDKYNDVKYWTDAAGNRRYSVVPKDLNEKTKEFRDMMIEAITESTEQSIITLDAPKETSRCSAVINIYDLHLDKLSQIGEEYTIDDNIELVRRGVAKLLSDLKHKSPELIYLPIGNDLFDGNDFTGNTKRGTDQKQSVHWKQSFQMGLKLIREIITSCLAITNNVIIVPVEGNHDEDKVFYLNEVLKVAYEQHKRVFTKESSAPRHYYQYGENMLGFGHGYHEKKKIRQLPGQIASEAPKVWGDTTYRRMLLGDIHHKEEYQFLKTVDKEGVTVSFLRDIGLNHSTWDRNKGYHIGPKSIEAQVFDWNGGQSAAYMFNV